MFRPNIAFSDEALMPSHGGWFNPQLGVDSGWCWIPGGIVMELYILDFRRDKRLQSLISNSRRKWLLSINTISLVIMKFCGRNSVSNFYLISICPGFWDGAGFRTPPTAASILPPIESNLVPCVIEPIYNPLLDLTKLTILAPKVKGYVAGSCFGN